MIKAGFETELNSEVSKILVTAIFSKCSNSMSPPRYIILGLDR